MSRPASKPTAPESPRRDAIVLRFAGDAGDSMMLAGLRFAAAAAQAGNDVHTLLLPPIEIRAPAGATTAGVVAITPGVPATGATGASGATTQGTAAVSGAAGAAGAAGVAGGVGAAGGLARADRTRASSMEAPVSAAITPPAGRIIR